MKTILNHEIVKIIQTETNYRVLIAMKNGKTLEHNPFPNDLRGFIAAMDLAINCASGKFYPMEVVSEQPGIEYKLKQIT